MKARKLMIICTAMVLCTALLGVGVYAVIVNQATISTNPSVTFNVEEVFFTVTADIDGGSYTDGTSAYSGKTYSGTSPSGNESTLVMSGWSPKISFAGSDELVITYKFKNDGPNAAKISVSNIPSKGSSTLNVDTYYGTTTGTTTKLTSTGTVLSVAKSGTGDTQYIIIKISQNNRLNPTTSGVDFSLGTISIYDDSAN